jgi:D-methionine transport system substrate-binding protein
MREKNMHKLTKTIVGLALCLALQPSASAAAVKKPPRARLNLEGVIKIGVTAGPHAEIMDNVKKLSGKART